MVTSYDLDFLCLTETHIWPFDSDSFLRSITLPDFNFPQKPRPSGIGGGVGFFTKSSYKPHTIESPLYQSFENMVVSIGLHGHSLLLACIYHPPGSCTCNFLEEFMSFVGYLSSINSLYYICGDFNIHVDVPVGGGHKFTTFLDSCDLKQLVDKPTHLHGHILDLILSPCDQDTIADVKVCDFVFDHALVKCSVAFSCQVAYTPNICQYINMSDFRLDLENNSFVKSPADAVVDLYKQYVHDLGYVLDRHAPLVSRMVKKHSVDWMSDDYRHAKSLRRQFERTWRRVKNPLNRSRLRHQIAQCNALVNKNKSDYYRKMISDNSRDSRKLHKTLNKVSDATLPSHGSDKSLADQFASFFSNKIKKIRDNFASIGPDNDIHPPSDPPKINVFRQVSEEAVDKIIKTTPTKSCLLDPLPTFLIKECIDILLPSLTKLVNCSLMEGYVPEAFKSAVVTPLIKKPNLPSNDLKNYHPVSGLSFISKLVERVVAKQLLEHIQTHNLDNPYQSAYKASHSTETALLYIKNEVHLSLSRGETTDDVKEWMSTSKLKLNPDKTEFIIFGSKRQRDNLKACFPIAILGYSLCPADLVKNLGVWFDSLFFVQACSECLQKLFC